MYTLKFEKLFREDLKEITAYINEKYHSPSVVKNLKNELKRNYPFLKNMPTIYPRVHDDYLTSLGIRFVVVKKYMLFFRIIEDKKIVSILRFIYGSRNWQALLRESAS